MGSAFFSVTFSFPNSSSRRKNILLYTLLYTLPVAFLIFYQEQYKIIVLGVYSISIEAES